MKAWIDPELCVGCAACEPTCPEDAITMDDLLAVVTPDSCTGCEDCKEICPADAISMLGDDEKPPERQERPARKPAAETHPAPAAEGRRVEAGDEPFRLLSWRPGRGELRRRLRRRLGWER